MTSVTALKPHGKTTNQTEGHPPGFKFNFTFYPSQITKNEFVLFKAGEENKRDPKERPRSVTGKLAPADKPQHCRGEGQVPIGERAGAGAHPRRARSHRESQPRPAGRSRGGTATYWPREEAPARGGGTAAPLVGTGGRRRLSAAPFGG